MVEGFGKPLRQHRIRGLARGADGLIYGVGGEQGGLPRLFAFDPVQRRMYLGTWPGGMQPEGGNRTFGDIGAVVSTADGTLICGERERRGYLLLYYPQDRPMSSGEPPVLRGLKRATPLPAQPRPSGKVPLRARLSPTAPATVSSIFPPPLAPLA